MARFVRIASQIRANRLILANRLRVPELNPLFFCGSRFGALKLQITGLRRFARIAQTLRNLFFFCESTRANRIVRIAAIRVANRRAV